VNYLDYYVLQLPLNSQRTLVRLTDDFRIQTAPGRSPAGSLRYISALRLQHIIHCHPLVRGRQALVPASKQWLRQYTSPSVSSAKSPFTSSASLRGVQPPTASLHLPPDSVQLPKDRCPHAHLCNASQRPMLTVCSADLSPAATSSAAGKTDSAWKNRDAQIDSNDTSGPLAGRTFIAKDLYDVSFLASWRITHDQNCEIRYQSRHTAITVVPSKIRLQQFIALEGMNSGLWQSV
jgi:hypothetical protein